MKHSHIVGSIALRLTGLVVCLVLAASAGSAQILGGDRVGFFGGWNLAHQGGDSAPAHCGPASTLRSRSTGVHPAGGYTPPTTTPTSAPASNAQPPRLELADAQAQRRRPTRYVPPGMG